jgi:hypothetical protein
MIQLPDTQLQVALRALNDVIGPALKGSESHVLEQFQLVMATLAFAQQRLPYTRRFYRKELRYFIDYAQEVAALVADHDSESAQALLATSQIGSNELHRPEAEAEDYLIVTRGLREGVSAAVTRSSGKAHEEQLDRLITRKLQELLPQQRSWFVPFGLDPTPQDLPGIADILAAE